MRFILLTLCALAALSRSVHADDEDSFTKIITPLPGRDTVKPMKPDWCADAEVEDWLMNSNDPLRAMQRTVDSGWGEKALKMLAHVACVRPNDPAYQKKVASWRQQYINFVGISEAEDRQAQKARAATTGWDKQKKDHCDSIAPGDEASKRDKAIGEALGAGTGCTAESALSVYADGQNKELGWWVDERATVSSEIVRSVYVTRCLRILERVNGREADWPDPKNTTVMAAYAACGPDARRLDRARLDKEITDSKLNDFAKSNAREVWSQAKVVSDFLSAAYQKMGAKDEAYQRLLFDAPEAGWKEWEKTYAEFKSEFEAARDYETKFYGPSKKKLQGCGAVLRKGFNAYIRAKKPKTIDEAKKAGLDDFGSVLLESLALCDGVEGRLQASQTEVSFLTGDGQGVPPTRRGPRMAAYNAALSALSDILSDRTKFPMKDFYLQIEAPRETLRDGATEYYTNKVMFESDPRGQIASIKKGADSTTVTFKPVTTMVWNRICTKNNRILRIESGGNVIYDSDCRNGTPPKIPITNKEKPLTVPNEIADGLKLGQTATFSVNARDEPQKMRDGVPKEVYGDSDLKKLVIWMGVAL